MIAGEPIQLCKLQAAVFMIIIGRVNVVVAEELVLWRLSLAATRNGRTTYGVDKNNLGYVAGVNRIYTGISRNTTGGGPWKPSWCP